jgi:peptide/nickel transport system substrate-binding protein
LKPRLAAALNLAGIVTTALGIGAMVSCGGAPAPATAPARLVATYRSEPQTFNRLVSEQSAEDLIARLTQAPLVRVNRATGAVEPWLAESLSASPDRRVWTLKLRDGVVFSDGAPFTSADVAFTFKALYDKKVASEIATSLLVDNKPLEVAAPDPHTVVITYPATFGPGISLLDALPILPAHALEASLTSGTFRDAWSLKTPLAQIAGLGPFVLAEYTPGVRLRFTRNPHYWRRAPDGAPLPKLGEIDLQFVPDPNTELAKLESGDVDLVTDAVKPEDLAALRPLETQGQIKIVDAGVSISPDFMWFNLKPGAPAAKERPWLQREEWRTALSYAVNRQRIVDTVYLGAAVPIFGPVTPGHGTWYQAGTVETPYDPAKASALLASIGLTDRKHTGQLDDAAGRPARFSVLTVKGPARERVMAMVAEDLKKIGVTLDIVPMEPQEMFARYGAGTYDAACFYFVLDSFDPGRNMDFWSSTGRFHLWDAEQKTAATSWEKAIDEDMAKATTSLDPAEARRHFLDAQRVLGAHMPMLYFAAPRVLIAMSSRVQGATPSVISPPILWNAEVLSVLPRPGGK